MSPVLLFLASNQTQETTLFGLSGRSLITIGLYSSEKLHHILPK
jgi:hypothetical protein